MRGLEDRSAHIATHPPEQPEAKSSLPNEQTIPRTCRKCDWYDTSTRSVGGCVAACAIFSRTPAPLCENWRPHSE